MRHVLQAKKGGEIVKEKNEGNSRKGILKEKRKELSTISSFWITMDYSDVKIPKIPTIGFYCFSHYFLLSCCLVSVPFRDSVWAHNNCI